MHPSSRIATRPAAGFTLIELSVVLVIIGLLVGGVLYGRDMMAAAQLRKIGSTIEEFKAAANTFRTKYGCIPGDCRKAISYFGQSPNGCFSWGATAYEDGTCNGDGNSVVGPSPGWDGNGAPDEVAEFVMFWNHLSNARLLKQNYGCQSKIIYSYNDPLCSPMLDTPQAGKVLVSIRPGFHWSYVWGVQPPKQDRTHQFLVGGVQGFMNANPAFAPLEAKTIDDKFDDGKPFAGKINAPWGTTSELGMGLPICTSGYEYRTEELLVAGIAAESRNCILYFDVGF